LEGPALDLGRALRADGHDELAAWLSGAIPEPRAIESDAHRPLLGERLRAVAEHANVPRHLREQAAHLAAVAADPVIAIGRVGTVWIAWCGEPDRPAASTPHRKLGVYAVSWQADGGDPDLYEDGPDFTSLDEALDWDGGGPTRSSSARTGMRDGTTRLERPPTPRVCHVSELLRQADLLAQVPMWCGQFALAATAAVRRVIACPGERSSAVAVAVTRTVMCLPRSFGVIRSRGSVARGIATPSARHW
jgi:hypothetical protein